MATKNKKQETKKIPPVTIENAKLMYRNFSGAAKKFNAKGLRNFHVALDSGVAQMLERDGWNVKWKEPQEEGDVATASIKVAVRFDNFPPRIVMITSNGRTVLDEDSVDILDWAEIESCDLQLSPSYWEVDKKKGIKAYLRKMFVTLTEDDLENKHRVIVQSKKEDDD
jgi:hypothetical protein